MEEDDDDDDDDGDNDESLYLEHYCSSTVIFLVFRQIAIKLGTSVNVHGTYLRITIPVFHILQQITRAYFIFYFYVFGSSVNFDFDGILTNITVYEK
jgi:hypothetical protein